MNESLIVHHFARQFGYGGGYRCCCDEFANRPTLDADGEPNGDWTDEELTDHAYQHGLTFDSIQQPRVGLLATQWIGSDRYGGVVTGMSPSGHRLIFRSKSGRELVFTRRKDGRYRPRRDRAGGLSFGHADDYWDPDF